MFRLLFANVFIRGGYRKIALTFNRKIAIVEFTGRNRRSRAAEEFRQFSQALRQSCIRSLLLRLGVWLTRSISCQ